MEFTRKQNDKLQHLCRFYPKKANRVIEALKNNKITMTNFWDDARKLTKRVVSDKSIKEWQIVFENVYDILSNEEK